MTKKTIDYSMSCVYRIAWKDVTYYVGSTTNFTQRKCQHKTSCKDERNKKKVYNFIRENGGWTEEWCMVLVKEYPNCKSAIELHKYEREAYDFYKPELNVIKPALRDDEKFVSKTVFQCENCGNTYGSNQGLWSHKKVCKATNREMTEAELHIKIDNIVGLLLEIATNQQINLTKKDGIITMIDESIDNIQNTEKQLDGEIDNIEVKKKTYNCVPCGCSFLSRPNLTKHFTSKKHIDKIRYPDTIVNNYFKCNNCEKTYKSNQGLWSHKNICNKNTTTDIIPIDIDLRTKIDNLETIMISMAKN